MISFATSLLLLGGLPVGGDSLPPGSIVSRTAEAVAVAWRVPAERVRLTWGRLPPHPIPADAGVRLLGRGADGWFVMMANGTGGPLAVRVRAGTEDTVLVAAAALAAGARLTEKDLARAARMHWGPPDSVTAPVSDGWLVRRALAPGEPLVPPAVESPPLVRAGEPVRFVWSRGLVDLEIEATALHDAGLGQLVHARGSASDRLVGAVIGAGRARMEKGN